MLLTSILEISFEVRAAGIIGDDLYDEAFERRHLSTVIAEFYSRYLASEVAKGMG